MASSSSLPALVDAAMGAQFEAFVRASFGLSVAPSAPDHGSFSMLVAFGRCRSRLEDSFVATCLSAILGGPASSFHVSQFEDRIFFFLVSSKQIGFEIYKLRSFACADFELFFQLFNESGLAFARSHICQDPKFPWVEVRKKSYAKAAKGQPALLTGANSIPIGSGSSKGRSQYRTSTGSRHLSVHHRSQATRNSGHIQFRQSNNNLERTSRQHFDRSSDRHHHQFKPNKNVAVHHSIHRQGWFQQRSAVGDPDSNIDWNLSFGSNLSGDLRNGGALAAVLCRRCHSSSHLRRECRAPIKCDTCLGWGHIAVNCTEKWKRFQASMKGRQLDNFAKDFGGNFDYSSWFHSSRMTMDPSSPPRFPDLLKLIDGSTASRVPPGGTFNHSQVNELCLLSPNHNPVHRPPSPSTELCMGDQILAFQRADSRPSILRGLNGGLPQDEHPAPGPDSSPSGGAFDLFGFGQIGPGPIVQSSHPVALRGGIPSHGSVNPNDGPSDNEWNAWPEDQNIIPDLNLNDEPENPAVFDLNAPAETEDMLINPVVHGPMPHKNFLEINSPLNQQFEEEDHVFAGQIQAHKDGGQGANMAPNLNEHPAEQQALDLNAPADMEEMVNEEEENVMEDYANPLPIQEKLAALISDPLVLEVNIPVLNHPMENVLRHENQEEDLMNDEEIQQQIVEEATRAEQVGPQNLQVGMVLLQNVTMALPELSPGPWANLFVPARGNSAPQVSIPQNWVNFFSTILLSPKHFEQAKELVQHKPLISCICDSPMVGFALPDKCPPVSEDEADNDNTLDLTHDESTIDLPPAINKSKFVKAKSSTKKVLVESDLRRSPRIKGCKQGYKDPICKDKHCVGCSAKPPVLSSKAIRKLSSSLCDIEASLVTDAALNKKSKVEAVGQKKKEMQKNGVNNKPKKMKGPAPVDVGCLKPQADADKDED